MLWVSQGADLSSHVDVAIIGAGVSGLVAAHRLQAAGLSVAVLEATGRTGGRTWSLPVPGGRIDLGATWVWDSEVHVHRLLAALGVQTFPHHQDGLDLLERADGVQRGRLPRGWTPERRVVGGTQSITDALAARVTGIALHSPVRTITIDEPYIRLHLTDRDIHARHVLAALPPAQLMATVALPDSLDPGTRQLLSQTAVWMADVAKVVAVYARPFWREAGLSGRIASLTGPMSEIHDMSGPDHRPAALFGFLHRSQAVGDWRAKAIAQLGRLLGAEASAPIHLHIQAWWETIPLPPGVGTAPSLLGDARLQQPLLGGRLRLISTETSPVSPGHIDGAVQRAEAAAAEIVALLGGAAAPPPSHA